MIGSRHRRLAAIDIGTVTARLLIADVSSAGIVEVVRSTDITHLGEGLSTTGRLAEDAMERVAACVARYTAMIEAHDVEEWGAVATSASRDAENGRDFLDLLERSGVRPEIIAGAREAELSFAGATLGATGHNVLVNDIGGGSTEIVVGAPPVSAGEKARIDFSCSVDVGSRRVTERFVHSDPPRPGELAAAREFIANAIGPCIEALAVKPARCISLAGTATTLSAISQRMKVYDRERVHGSVVTVVELQRIIEMLSGMTLSERKEVLGLHPDRAGVIVAGLLVLETLLGMVGLESTEVSEHDLLYGILLDTFGRRFLE